MNLSSANFYNSQFSNSPTKEVCFEESSSNLVWTLAAEYQANVLELKGWKIYRDYSHPLFVKFNSKNIRPQNFVPTVNFTIDESILNEIDLKYGKMIYDRTYKTHAIKLPQNILNGPFSISKLAEYLVKDVLGDEFTGSGYRYPLDRNQNFGYNGIYELDEHKDLLVSFLSGLDVEPSVIKLSDIPNSLEILATAKFKALAIDNIDSDLCLLMNSTYKGFDNMKENPCVIIPIKEAEYNPRTISTFATQIFYREDDNKFQHLKSIGAGWKIRNKTNHNYIEFLKNQAKTQ